MKDFGKLLQGVICKKNLGYRFHRAYVPEGQFFTKSLEITPKDVEVAQNILKIINIKNREDLFLGLTCVALLSSYEKREKAKAKYNGNTSRECVAHDNLYLFKGCVNKLIIEGLKHNIDFKFCVKKDAKGADVTYISLAGVQFSFHNTNTARTVEFARDNGLKQYSDLEWDRLLLFKTELKKC